MQWFNHFAIGNIICCRKNLLSTLIMTLRYIYSQKKICSHRVPWIEFLQDYTFTLRHKTGVDNKAANALSRVFSLSKMFTVVIDFERIKNDYDTCPNFNEVYMVWKDETTPEIDGYILQDGFLFLGRKLCIPHTSLREFLVWELHASGLARHFENEDHRDYRIRFFWPSPKRDIAKCVTRCHTYQLMKQQKHNTDLYTPLLIPNCPW